MNATERCLDAIREELSRFHGIDLTPAQTEVLFAEEHELFGYLLENGMDTGGREYVCAILGQKLVGRDWPCGGDGEAVGKAFLNDLKAALKARGIAHRIT